jgi:hypothetical protein
MTPESSAVRRAKTGAKVGGAMAALAGAFAAAKAAALGLAAATRVVALGIAAVRFGLRVATLRVWRRCPDCYSRIDGRARVCPHCAFRMRRPPAVRGGADA